MGLPLVPEIVEPAVPARALRSEFGPLVALAIPAIVGSMGNVLMTLVDTAMVGGLGAEALAAVGVASAIWVSLSWLFVGMVEAAGPFVAQSWGADDRRGMTRWAWQGAWLAALTSLPLMLLGFFAGPVLSGLGQEPVVVQLGADYLLARGWFALPGFLFFAERTVLNAVGRTRDVLIAVLVANVVNAIANWGLIYGNLGLPALGVTGAGYATGIAKLVLLGITTWRIRRLGVVESDPSLRRPDRAALRRLLAVGIPAGLHSFADSAICSALAVLAGWMGSVPLAAHQVAFRLTIFLFTIPKGLGVAAAALVGQSIGAGRPDRAARVGAVAMITAVTTMCGVGLAVLAGADRVVAVFTPDPRVRELAGGLLAIAALFEIFDSLQIVATSCLLAAGDTRVPMLVSIVVYWGFGFPLAWHLGFSQGLGSAGLWWGLTAALGVVAGLMATRFLSGSWQARGRLVG